MPADDRDPKFERALAQHLRGDSAAACPDAETLAAYQEKSLSLEEMMHWKQHISGCAACQETLALVETTEKQRKEDWENQEIPVFAAAGQPPAAMRSLAAVKREARAEEMPAARVAAPVEIAWRRRPALLRWAIPVGAAAAGVLLWIGFHEQRASQPSKSATVQMTKNLPAPVPAPEQKLNDGGQAAPPMERDSLGGQFNEKSSRAREEYTGAETQLGSPGAPLGKPQAQAKDAEDTKKEAGGRRADTFTYNAAPPPPPPPARVLQQPKAPSPSSTTQSVEVSAAAPAVTSEPSAKTNDGAAGGVVGGAGTGIANETVELESKSEARKKERATARQQGANDLDTASAMMRKQGMTNRNANALTALAPLPAVILTPDHRVWWRLGPGGTLELTADSGKTWKPVSAGANAQLTTGSAPSSKICWIAGKAGTLVLTTDRGTHWKVLTTPISGDLGGVSAKDAKHASIWDAARQQSFETSDGGANWKPAAP